MVVVRLSVLHTGHPLPPGRFLVLISIRGSFDPRAIVQLEGLVKLKKKNPPLWDLNPRPSCLRHSASVNYSTMCSSSCHNAIVILFFKVRMIRFLPLLTYYLDSALICTIYEQWNSRNLHMNTCSSRSSFSRFTLLQQTPVQYTHCTQLIGQAFL
jgi:hypothetical protein